MHKWLLAPKEGILMTINNEVLLKFGLDEEKLKNHEFERLCEDFRFGPNQSNALGKKAEGPGIYFFLINIGTATYELYIGKSKCVKRRMKEYCCEFQPRSADDSKVRLIRGVLAEIHKSRSLTVSLYIKPCSSTEDLGKIEKAEINEFQPLINKLRKLNDGLDICKAASQKLEKAYIEYFSQLMMNGLRLMN